MLNRMTSDNLSQDGFWMSASRPSEGVTRATSHRPGRGLSASTHVEQHPADGEGRLGCGLNHVPVLSRRPGADRRHRGWTTTTSVSTFLGRVPFRTFPATGWPFFSCPRCSVSSWSRAVSSTCLVSCFSSPSSPVSDKLCSRTRAPAPPPPAPQRSAPACSSSSQHPVSRSLRHLSRRAHQARRVIGPETPIDPQSREIGVAAPIRRISHTAPRPTVTLRHVVGSPVGRHVALDWCPVTT
jgi:hypothetical protein